MDLRKEVYFDDVVFWKWVKSEHPREEIILDEFVTMPNHFHGVVFSRQPDAVHTEGISVGAQGLASLRGTGVLVWQSRFHDQISRGEDHLETVRCYIQNNPLGWANARENQ